MDTIFMDWAGMLIRWLHVMAGITWIGSSFYFMHIDAALRPVPEVPAGKGGQAWEVHGGGFYRVTKYLIAPDTLPKELIWHKWESYTTWMSGFFLMVWVYYLGADLYLIDPAVRDLSPVLAVAIGIAGLVVGWLIYSLLCRSPLGRNDGVLAAIGFVFVVASAWGFQQVFSGRGALIHTGAMMGTIMAANVFMVIIPNQRIVIADLMAGRTPDAKYGKIAKTRSTHNNYLTLPVVFLMLSSHYPLVFTSPHAWIMVALVLVAGALVRHFFNEDHAGRGRKWWTWMVAAICMAGVAALSWANTPAGREALGGNAYGAAGSVTVAQASHRPVPSDVAEVVSSRCAMCHSAEPAWAGLAAAPKGIVLDTPEAIARHADAIRMQAVLTRAMPPSNITHMEPAERRVLAAWIEAR